MTTDTLAGIDLTTRTVKWLLRNRQCWIDQFGKWITMDSTLLDAVACIDAELESRGITPPPKPERSQH